MKLLYIVRYEQRKNISSFLASNNHYEQPSFHIWMGSSPLKRKFHDEHHNMSEHYSANELCLATLTSYSIWSNGILTSKVFILECIAGPITISSTEWCYDLLWPSLHLPFGWICLQNSFISPKHASQEV